MEIRIRVFYAFGETIIWEIRGPRAWSFYENIQHPLEG